jgi:hypothetical protein
MGAIILSFLSKFKLCYTDWFFQDKELLATSECQQFQDSAMQHADTI